MPLLFGRNEKIQLLQASFESSQKKKYDGGCCNEKGQSPFVVVQGFSGTGKSSLIHTTFRQASLYFGSGKYEEDDMPSTHPIPYSAIMEAIQGALEQLSKRMPLSQMHTLQSKLQQSSKLYRLFEYIPRLRLLTRGGGAANPESSTCGCSPQASTTTLANRNETDRIRQELQELMRITASLPIVIFMDDLQWADSQSVELLSLLFGTEQSQKKQDGSWLWVGAVRETREGESLLPKALHDKVTTLIPLHNLSRTSVRDWLVDTLDCHPEDRHRNGSVEQLADVVHRKTMGNALFVSMFIDMLQSEGQLWYDVGNMEWKFDVKKIESETVASTNVVDFLISRLQSMPRPMQLVLQLASCVGNRIDAEVLQAIVTGIRAQGLDSGTERLRFRASNEFAHEQHTSLLETDDALNVKSIIHSSLERGFVERCKDGDSSRFMFAHDRIHQACYALVDSPMLHLQIGRSLWTILSTCEQSQSLASAPKLNPTMLLLVVTEQLNRGSDLIEDGDDLLSLMLLNLRAARAMQERSAFLAASEFCKAGLRIASRQQHAWSRLYNVLLPLHTLRADMDYIVGDHRGANESVDAVLSNAVVLDDMLPVFLIKMESLGSEGRTQEAMEVGSHVLARLGEKLPQHPTRRHLLAEFLGVRRMLKGHSDESLLALPTLTCRNKLIVLEILSLMGGYAYAASQPLLIMIVGLREMRILLNHGLSKYAADAFATYGTLMGHMSNFAEAFRFGQLSLNLVNRFQAREHDSKTLLAVNFFVHHLRRPIHESIEPLLSAYQLGMEVGDIRNASMSFYAYICCYAICGLPLGPVLQDTNGFRVELGQYGQDLMFKLTSSVYQTMLNLVGRSQDPLRLKGEAMDEDKMLQEAEESNNVLLAQNIFLQRAILANYFNDFEMAGETVARVSDDMQINTASCNFVAGATYFVLALSALGMTRARNRCRKFIRKSRQYTRRLKTWVKQGEPNVHHMLLILRAEQLSLRSRKVDDVKEAYDRAIAVSSRTGFLQNAALANERAGIFFLARGDHEWAEMYISKSYQLYADWGAHAKLDQMTVLYPFLSKSKETMVRRHSTQRFGRSRFSSPSKVWSSASTELDLASDTSTAQRMEMQVAPRLI